MKIKVSSPLMLTACALLAMAAKAHAFDYTITDIGLLAGDVTSFANGINTNGDVTGYYFNSSNVQTAFLYSAGTFTALTVGGESSGGYGINDSGTVVGTRIVSPFTRNAFISSSGGTTVIADGTTDFYGTAINAGGTITGTMLASTFGQSNYFQAYTSSGGAPFGLGTLGGNASQAFGINAAGTIVGQAQVANGDTHAFSFSGGTMTDIGTLGGNFSTAKGLNTAGTIVGSSSSVNDGPGQAFSFSGTTMTNLGTLGGAGSTAAAINAGGQIVGASQLFNSSQAGFVYKDGTMQNLTDLVDGQLIFNATGINDFGQITALGTVAGHTHALLLTPTAPIVITIGSDVDARVAAGLSFDQIGDVTNLGSGLPTIVSFLAGSASANRNVVVAFTGEEIGAASSVVDVSGTVGDIYVLQLSYDPTIALDAFGSEENARLMWYNGSSWVNAVDGNVGGTPNFVGDGSYNADIGFQLGNYGVDTANNTVWAVINHNSPFAVIPEPGVTGMLALGLGFAAILRRRICKNHRP